MSTYEVEEYDLEIEDPNLDADPRYEGVVVARLTLEVQPPLQGSFSYNAASDIDYHGHDAYVEDWKLEEVWDLTLQTDDPEPGDWREPTDLERAYVTAYLADDKRMEALDEAGRDAFNDDMECRAEAAYEDRYYR